MRLLLILGDDYYFKGHMGIKKISACCGVLTYISELREWEEQRLADGSLPSRLFELCERCHSRVIEYQDTTRAAKEMLAARVMQGMLMNPKSTNWATSPGETIEAVNRFVREVQKHGFS